VRGGRDRCARKALLPQAVAQLVQVDTRPVHEPPDARGEYGRRRPLEIRLSEAVYFDVEKTRRRKLQRVLLPALDWLGDFFRRHLADGKVDR